MAAAETIEVVPIVEDDHRAVEIEPEPQPWPSDAGMEAASLAPFAGEEAEPARRMAPKGVERQEHETAPPPVRNAETEEGIPFTGEAERVLEQAAAEAPAAPRGEPPAESPLPLADEDVRPAAERPANPRRGWWQRLTQS